MFDLDIPKLAWMRQAENLDLAIKALESVREQAVAGTLPELPHYLNPGICAYWGRALHTIGVTGTEGINWSHDTIEIAAMSWPLSVGFGFRRAYPVPYTLSRWKGEGLELRLSLIDHTLTLLRATREYVTRTQE